MIWKLLRKNISVGQIAGYALANFIGLSIVLSAIRFYGDVSAALDTDSGDNNLISRDFLVVSKPVKALGGLLSPTPGFSQAEIDDILAQPWAMDAGKFSSADFSVNAAVDFGGNGMTTFLFLESIPDDFIDIKAADWKVDTSDPAAVVPIIMSKDYLALYNFGFAPSRGLPQISEGMVSSVPIMLQMSGNGHNDLYRARIVGFSSRLNTIAVPDEFLAYANAKYTTTAAADPSRLIIKVNKPGDPAISDYMHSKGYEVAGEKLDSGKASYFLTLLTSIVIAIGAIISALALFILMLSIFLLLQKNREKISDLLLLGYSPAQVSSGYYRLIGVVNGAVLVLSLGVMFGASAWWESRLAALSIEPSSALPAIFAALVIMGAITAVNFTAIARSVRRTFRS